MNELCRQPLLLRADNFTPPTRTPWGGTKILSNYKDAGTLSDEAAAYPLVGESWELSVEPDFPSYVEAPAAALLSDVLASAGKDALGVEAQAGSTALLVKLLDAADDLSVQIHPSDDDPLLGPGESGKPESWYVLQREPGAGLYIGLRQGVDEQQMRQTLRAGGDVSTLLQFVPVEPGDFFLIEAGTAHAIGKGVTLVEPQRVVPGKRGLTYRYWDWNRRYDEAGRRDASGRPRALHVERALAVTRWEAPREEAMLESIRLRAPIPDLSHAARQLRLCGPDAPLRSDALIVSRLAGTGFLMLQASERLRALTVVDGTITLRGPGFELRLSRGRTVALPAALPSFRLQLDGAHAVLCAAA